ncbi:type II toxin-antitoxin system Rv0910 family toxin [Gordonia sp. DT30]|uniref:type II toxin-antitoxin system Rv0910 family toxin n=1 Tax=unclassified Gordonia (in: high G+C Gram-positive bacteria) TaxID=2657482 RepID=UPI003CF3DD32
MAKTSDSIELELSPEDTWTAASDLSRFDEWLVLHGGWRSAVPGPDELGKGTKITSIVKVKGNPVRIDWVIDKYVTGREVRLKGSGKGGIKVKLDLSVGPGGAGSVITFAVDLGGLPMIGPIGMATAKVIHGDLQTSLATFQQKFG